MAKIIFNESAEWTLEDYKALYNAVVSMSFDVEGMAAMKAPTDYKERLSYVAAIVGCVNDVPAREVKSANIEPHFE